MDKFSNENICAKIALGTAQFGLNYGISNKVGQTDEVEVFQILQLAKSIGISTLDTAYAYGNSQNVLGDLHEGDFNIITKLSPDILAHISVETLLLNSFNELKVERLYGVLFHSAESALNNPKAYFDLLKEKEKGKVKKIGFSVYTPQELEALISKYGTPDLIQIPFSLLDTRFEKLAVDMHSKGVEIHSRSTFLQGLFFMNPSQLTTFFNPLKIFLNQIRSNFATNSELAAYLLKFVLSKPFIDKVIIGVNNAGQLRDNVNNIKTMKSIYFETPDVSEEILLPNLWPKQ
jgi:aryl-alcohol dehydrogenase-like predicted oxidoreductase